MIGASSDVIAHIGYPTHSFKSPYIYNPYFEANGIDAVVVPMSCQGPHLQGLIPSIFSLDNISGALITMPHKVNVVNLLDRVSAKVHVAGSCNAVRKAADGSLVGDMFDGEGFVRGVQRKGFKLQGCTALVIGCGGVGSAIVASLAASGVRTLSLYDSNDESSKGLKARVEKHYPDVSVTTGSNDPKGFDLVVNATPMGMNSGDPLPLDISRLDSRSFVGEVVMKREMTAFLQAAADRGCRYQIGTDMLFEMIPAYLEFFGYPSATAESLRATAKL